MPPVYFLRAATLQLTVCQRGKPKGEKGKGQTKPDKNRHSQAVPAWPHIALSLVLLAYCVEQLPLQLRFFLLLGHFSPTFADFYRQVFRIPKRVQTLTSLSPEIIPAHGFLRKPVVFHCISENDSQKVNAVTLRNISGMLDIIGLMWYN